MNAKALSLGMLDSHYMNPHGLDQVGHYSSAYDLAISGWYALHHPTIKSIIRLDTYSFEGHDFYNVNSFIRRYPGATGIKPGWTDDAGHCLIASATNNGHTVIGVILNTPYNLVATDIDTLMDYSFSLLSNQAQPQSNNSGASAYIGLPEGDRLVPFDTKPLVEFYRWLSLNIGQWFHTIQQNK
jgi:D-alanyl-D-alanine carboxypeptidase (penicillin-binding protein 5/6)